MKFELVNSPGEKCMASIFKAVLYLSVLLFKTWETLGRVFGVKLLKEGNSVFVGVFAAFTELP